MDSKYEHELHILWRRRAIVVGLQSARVVCGMGSLATQRCAALCYGDAHIHAAWFKAFLCDLMSM